MIYMCIYGHNHSKPLQTGGFLTGVEDPHCNPFWDLVRYRWSEHGFFGLKEVLLDKPNIKGLDPAESKGQID